MGIPDHLTWETCMQVGKQQLEPDMEERTGSKLGKEYVKVVYCHPPYLTYMQRTSCELPRWMNHKLESRVPGEIEKNSDMQMIPPSLMAESEEQLKSLLMKVKAESEKAGLQLSIQKAKIMVSCLIISWQIDGETMKRWQTFFPWASKSLQMVTAAMKWKEACSLKEKLWPT